MTKLAVFSFGNQEIRTATDEHGEIWFVAADVCSALEHTNPTKAVADHVDDEDKANFQLGLPGRAPTVVNESGLYALIFGSRKEAAKRFKRWVTSEVLPAIRKNGYYASNESASLQQPAAAETVDAVMRVVGGMVKTLRLDTDDYLMLLRYSLGKYDQKLAEIVPQELLTARASIPIDAQWGVDTSFDLAGLLEDFGSVFLDVDSFLRRMMVCGVVAERTVYDEQTQSLIRQKRLQNTYFGINCGSGRNAVIGWYRDRFKQALALATNVR
jgi:prophage antirepressor-like protein